MFTLSLSVLAALLGSADAYWILPQGTLLHARLDPIVSPGAVSGHVHTVVGASRFAPTYNYDDLITSKCTTAPVQADKSVYWAPTMYSKGADGTFSLIDSYSNIYYLQRSNKDKVQAFPPGLRMLAGNMERRDYNASNLEDLAVSFVCLDYAGGHNNDPAWAQRENFFAHNCPNGMRAQINFPPCWDGVNLDSPDHKSHMSYPVGSHADSGDCPASHPVHLVSLFYEFVFSVQDHPFDESRTDNWVFSFGDETGYGFHGDFINGWPQDLLQSAIDTCGDETGGSVSKCAVLAAHIDQAAASSCVPEGQVPAEDVGENGPLKALPGCNPLWPANVIAKPTCAAGTVAAVTSLVSTGVDLPSGWSSLGCIAEPSKGRALTGSQTQDPNMTVEKCIATCVAAGASYAGVEYTTQCFCGNGLSNGASTTQSNRCTNACPGKSTTMCGGGSALNLYQLGSGSTNNVVDSIFNLVGGASNSGAAVSVASSASAGSSVASLVGSAAASRSSSATVTLASSATDSATLPTATGGAKSACLARRRLKQQAKLARRQLSHQ